MRDTLDPLYQLDISVMKMINHDYAATELDRFWVVFTNMHHQPWFWPLMAPALFLWAASIYRWEIWKPLVALTMAIAIADGICYRFLKPMFNRPRPFQNPEISDWLRHTGEAGGLSFPSNHAANMFAAAMVLAWYFPKGRHFFFILAALIAISRVAVGVHYPFDILAGAWLGIFVGFLIRALALNQFRVLQPNRLVSAKYGESSKSRTNSRRRFVD